MAELPKTPKVELLVSDVDLLSSCCCCREKEGVLKCSGCKAVTYCGEECQEKGWNYHTDVCIEIMELLQQANVAVEALAFEYGGVEAFLENTLVKNGFFRSIGKYKSKLIEKYDIAISKLIDAYVKCGKEASSKLAFRLAAENLLHMLQLCNYRRRFLSVFEWREYGGWMVAGDMDQQALNLLGYIQSRIMDQSSDLFLSVQEDIEDLSIVSQVKEKLISPNQLGCKVHDFTLISLIKYKRIKALEREEERWNTFLEGTQLRSGESSVVLMLSGMAPVLEKLKEFVVGNAIDERIDSLTNQVNELLNEVNEKNTKLIRGILDGQVEMVDNPTDWKEYFSHLGYTDPTDEDKDWKEYFSHLGSTDNLIPPEEKEVHIARYAVKMYGHAWNIDNDCTRALRLFLETGNVMEAEEDNSPQTVPEEDSSPETEMSEEDTSTETEIQEDDTSPETEMLEEEDKSPETEMLEEEDKSPETEMAKKDTSPETQMAEEDSSPETQMPEEDGSPENEMSEEDTSPETQMPEKDTSPET